ncbi:MAG TPA: hypothetical protein VGM70_12360 [Pseudolysinimonas sp.]|jgi:hypothetical protein
MTTFQEPPLQSRRAARQGERADAPPGIPADQAAPNPNGAATTTPASSAPLSSAAPLAPEPLNYATTNRPPLPQYDGQSLRPRRSAETPGHADLPPTEALPSQDAPSYRPKDFSPEGRRSAAPQWAPPYEGSASAVSPPPVADAAVVAEGTMTRRELRALRESNGITAAPTDQTPVVAPAAFESAPVDTSPVAAPVQAAPPVAAPIERPAAVVVPPAPVEPPALVVPPATPPAPQPSTRLDSALAEFDALASGRTVSVPAPDAPAPLPGRRAAQQAAPVPQAAPTDAPAPDGLSAFDALFNASSDELPELVIEAEPEAPGAQTPPPSAAAQLLAPPSVAAAAAPAPPVVDALLSAPAPQGMPAMVPPPVIPAPAGQTPLAPTGGSPETVQPASGPSSVGHWSTQADIDDAEQVNESTISRSVGVGNGAITTSALVLPSVPEHTIGGPMSGSGEILLTGSISLPQSLSMTGAHPSQLDESDLDHLLDPGDQQISNTDSTPVRAARAVSTHTATGGIIAPQKPKGTRGFTILIIAASAMAVVVVGLLVAGLVSGTL